jgi:hypothetical protein
MAMRLLTALPTDLDPAVFLSLVASQRGADAALRIQAAAVLMSYRHSRMTARSILVPLDLPEPTVEAATENVAKIGALAPKFNTQCFRRVRLQQRRQALSGCIWRNGLQLRSLCDLPRYALACDRNAAQFTVLDEGRFR